MWILTCLPLLVYLVQPIHCANEEKVAKVICSLSNFKDIDILKGKLAKQIQFSKTLFQECSIKFRMVTSDMIHTE